MTSVFILGAGGAGKTTLIQQYLRESDGRVTVINEIARTYMEEKRITQTDLQDDTIFWNLQIGIIQRQLKRESELQGTHFISDRSAADALIYAAIRKPERFPLLSKDPVSTRADSQHPGEALFGPLLRGADASWRTDVDEMVLRYRRSLVVLVHPFSETVVDDGVRVVMNASELEQYTLFCRRALILLDVPFVDLRERELQARLRVMERALKDHILPSPLATLERFETRRSKKGDRKTVNRHFISELNLPFYRSRLGRRGSPEIQLPCISLSGSGLGQTYLSPVPGLTNRFLEHNASERIFLLEFARDLPAQVVRQVLSTGVKIQGETYSFLGCSTSGLKIRKCYLWRGTAGDAEAVRQQNGDFSSLKSIPKQIARFSLLLTNVVATSVMPSTVSTQPDVELESGANFTDGCGCISPDLAGPLFRQTRKILMRKSEKVIRSPSIFQIRFQGYKGIVAVDSRLNSGTIVVRPSMLKFKTDCFPRIYVCDYSRPYSFGHLNRQFILLLSGLGVPDDVFMTLQREHFDLVRSMLYNRDSALMLLEWHNRAIELLAEPSSEANFAGNVVAQMQNSSFAQLRSLQQRFIAECPRLRILIPESRNLFGVAETPRFCSITGRRLPGVLQYGECFVRMTMHGEQTISLQNQPVLVSKNPCYLLGDIRVLRAVSEEERPALGQVARDLVDCIVFPIEGPRPHSAEIAGSDLDGDQYFVCWDKRLIPPRTVPAYDYPAYVGDSASAAKQSPTEASEKASAMVDFFSVQNVVSARLGRVDSLFRTWADLKGSVCSECERLGQLFSRVVDSAKSGEHIVIPAALDVPMERRPTPSADSNFVWQRMVFAATEFVEQQQTEQAYSGTLVPYVSIEESAFGVAPLESSDEVEEDEEQNSFLLSLVARNHLAMSEFTKFRLVMQYLDGDVEAFFESDFAKHVNFGLFSESERGFVVDKYGIPPHLVGNALRCYSRIVGFRLSFLSKFGFDGQLPWVLYWRTGRDGTSASFPARLLHALRRNTDVLLLVQAPDAVVVVLQFSRSVMSRKETLFTEDRNRNGCRNKDLQSVMTVNAFFISGHFGYMYKYSLEDPEYRIDLSDNGLQLYRGEQGQTFVHLKAVGSSCVRRSEPKKKKSHLADTSPHLVAESGVSLVQISTDLTRFNRRILSGSRRHPTVRKIPVYDLEMFVYNRRSDYSERPRGISYLDILWEDPKSYLQATRCEEDVDLEDDNVIEDDLLPSTDDLMATYEEQFLNCDGQSGQGQNCLATILVSLLKSVHQRFGLCNCIARNVRELISSVAEQTLTIAIPRRRMETIVDVVVLLADLEIWTVSELPPILHNDDEDTDAAAQLSTFLEFVRRWDVWVTLPNAGAREVLLSWLKSGIDAQLLDPHLSFVFRNACEQATVLLSELQDGSLDGIATSSVTSIGNLRLDFSSLFQDQEEIQGEGNPEATSKKKMPIINLYRVHAIPMGVRFSIGEYVYITRQAVSISRNLETPSSPPKIWSEQEYEENFPPLCRAVHESEGRRERDVQAAAGEYIPKKSGSCLARVVSLCEAPFSISLKLFSPSFGKREAVPELLSQCLTNRKSVYWQVSVVPANVTTHTRIVNAIDSCLDSERDNYLSPCMLPYLVSDSSDVINAEQNPVFGKELPLPSDLRSRLNAGQFGAVQSSLRHRVSLVHGPPGAGKTSVLVQIMIQILMQSQHRVLVCAETNLAVDNLASRFLQECTFPHGAIRIGSNSTARADSELSRIHLENLVRDKSQENTPKPMRQFFLSAHKKIIRLLFMASRIVFTTCAGAGDPVLSGQLFETVLMDEASMTTEPGALCPIVHGCRHLVLIGDHEQLGPHANRGACISLFERLLQSKSCVHITALHEQYRMHPLLCSFPSRTFYGGCLVAAPGVEQLRTIPKVLFGSRSPVRFVNVPNGREQRIGSGSWFNEVEVGCVSAVVEKLLGSGQISASKVTVLTLYRAQQMKIREQMSGWRSAPPEVCSVDGFQGRENDIILVSTVRCGGSLGFCDDKRRVNVLLTRAKCGLIVFGHRPTLEKSMLWSKWLQESDSLDF